MRSRPIGRSCLSSSPKPAGCSSGTLKVAQEWFPHDFIPYRLGRDFDKEPWTPDQPRLTGVAQTAFEIGLLTEDNLPSYHRLIHGMFGKGDGAWLNWVGRWTAEEGRHAIVLRDYLTVTRNIDPVRSSGVAWPSSSRATSMRLRRRCAAWPTSRSRSWPRGSRTGTPVASRPIRWPTGSWFASLPTRTCTWSSTATSWAPRSRSSRRPQCGRSSTRCWRSRCRGRGSRASCARPRRSRRPGIYDLRVHRDEVLLPILRHWRIFELEGLDAAAEDARRRLAEHLAALDDAARRFEQRVAASGSARVASTG